MYVMKFEMAHDNSSGAAAGGARREVSPPAPPGSPPPPDRAFHHRILQLKKQQQLQQQILLEHYQQQQQQLTEQYEAQIQQQWKLWEQQKALEEQAAREARERRERERLELLRKKDKHDHSAIASTEVKQKLQVFLMKKQAAASANGTVPGSPYRNWGVVKSSSGESITSSVSNSHPYRMPQQPVLTKYDSNDFPLRKTASEPNMLKVRLKARVIERRASPMARRPQAKLRGGKVTHHRANDTSGSPRGSPTGGAAAPIREEEEGGFAAPAPAPAAIDLQLFSSPSMPNISLGRPHITSGAPSVSSLFTYVSCVQEGGMLAPVSEARGAEVAPYYAAPAPVPAAYITGAQVAQARLHKRPLGRTQSAPLPLGEPQYALRQQIRQTVLTRAARLPEEPDLIDLTDKRPRGANSSLPPTAACGDTGEQRPTPDDARPANPLSRTLSSPLVGAPAGDTPCTGLAYDALMLKHACACGARAPQHPEHGGRLQSVWARLHETGLAARCRRTRPAKATLEELQTCHSEAHTLLFGTNPLNRAKHASRLAALPMKSLVKLACGGLGVDSDTTWSELHTAPAARMAAGCVIDLAFKCYAGELKNGFAVVRPPGHHAERTQAMGFCFFNSVAVAAKLLQQRMNLQRILIVDWDVHHGNGTQQIFYDDPQVLYISIHRHDDGNFFPGTGGPTECGSGAGLGYNVNIAWSGGLTPPLGDAEYLAAFRTIVMPIAKEYKPQMVLVSCGFDAAAGHPAPLGGYNVSPACFGHMTKELMQLADGKVVLALEGGYDLPGMCDCAQECVRALLGDETAPLPAAELTRVVAPHALDTLHKTVAVQLSHWSCVKRYSVCAGVSAMNAARLLQSERDAADTTLAMASLSMRHLHQQSVSPDESREVSEEPMEQDEGK